MENKEGESSGVVYEKHDAYNDGILDSNKSIASDFGLDSKERLYDCIEDLEMSFDAEEIFIKA